MFALIHKHGCGNAAFALLCQPLSGGIVSSTNARHLNGSDIAPHTEIRCDSCGEKLCGSDVRTEYIEPYNGH